MNDKNVDHGKKLSRISDLLTAEQEAQLTLMLADLIIHKWASLTIEIVNGKVRFFRPQPSIEAVPPGILFTK